jgi:dTDP-4-amino-4,6-dideoxygalactose transaminase
MFIPTFQGLGATDLVRGFVPRTDEPNVPYPFSVPHLTFYRARNAIYHLFRALRAANRRVTVLLPDYNSGNEVLALDAAGADLRYYHVPRDSRVDVSEVERLCTRHHVDVLYVIHYLGWPQPIREFADLAERLGIWLVEDCALSLLSYAGDEPLGTFGHWSIFCLYKTLPVPNGACLVENAQHLCDLDDVQLKRAGLPSVLGTTTELLVRHIRSRSESVGAALQSMKRAAGRAAGAMEVTRASVGDIGFNLDQIDLAMSAMSARLLKRLDFDAIRARRIANYDRLAVLLDGSVTPLFARRPDGVCPLMFPILVNDKRAAAERLRSAGIDALEFWNYGAGSPEGEGAAYLRRHVLGLPIHQDLAARHVDYVAVQTARLQLRMQ